jgi:two-component system phosphate regulon response regulator PhoB
MQMAHEAERCPICDGRHREEPRAHAPARILIAEDDPAIANLIAYNLEQDGYDVSIAEDGVEALRRLREEPPQLLILDLLLPLQSGWQVLREMRLREGTRLATLPVLIISALACDRLGHDLARIGAQRLLGKPFSVAALRATVRELFDQPPNGEVDTRYS